MITFNHLKYIETKDSSFGRKNLQLTNKENNKFDDTKKGEREREREKLKQVWLLQNCKQIRERKRFDMVKIWQKQHKSKWFCGVYSHSRRRISGDSLLRRRSLERNSKDHTETYFASSSSSSSSPQPSPSWTSFSGTDSPPRIYPLIPFYSENSISWLKR